MSTTASSSSPDRLVVPDVLRGVAILAMLIAHAAPLLTVFAPGVRFAIGNINDLASPLFALVMGVSAQIVLARTVREDRRRMLLQQFARGIILIALGWWMSGWGSWVAIVLSYLGVLLIVGVPVLQLKARWVGAIAVGLAVISDPLTSWASGAIRPLVSGSPVATEIANWFVLGSSYRVANLLPFFLLGALLMRHGFRRDRYLWAMAVIAPIAYAVRPVGAALSDAARPVSGSYADTLHDVGLVFAVYVIVVVLATVRGRAPARVIAVVFEPFRAIGAVALSLYVAHVGLIALWAQAGLTVVGNDYVRWLAVVAGTVLVGWLWWRFIGVGPVEWLLGWVTGRPKRWRRVAEPHPV